MTSHSLGTDTRSLTYDALAQITDLDDARHSLDVDYDVLGRVIDFAASTAAASTWLALAEVSANDSVYLDSVNVPAGVGFVWTPSMPSTAGSYEIRQFEVGTFNRVATSDTISVSDQTNPVPPTIHVSSTAGAAYAVITATLYDGPGNSNDWWGLSAVGASDYSYVRWKYVPAGSSADTWQVSIPATTGDYEFRLYENNTYNRLATSSAITIGTGTPPPIDLSATSVNVGDVLTIATEGTPTNY